MRFSDARALPGREVLRHQVQNLAWAIALEQLPAGVEYVLLPQVCRVPRGEAYLAWEPGIAVEPGTEVSWSFTEHGQTTTGTATVYDRHVTGAWPDADLPATAQSRLTPATALWELLPQFEQAVSVALERTNRYIARELDGTTDTVRGSLDDERTNAGVVDDVTLDRIASDLLYGAPGDDDSVIIRMIRRAATTSINNQPLPSWCATYIQSRAESAVRRAIGDPHMGPKVRRLFREQQPATLDELIDLYREAHPRDRAGKDRIVAALSAGRHVNAGAASMDALFAGTGLEAAFASTVARDIEVAR